MAMQPFKVGDKVKCVEPPHNHNGYTTLKAGDVGTVLHTKLRIPDGEPMVTLVGFSPDSWYRSNRFVLVGRALSDPSPAPSAVAVGALKEEELRVILTTSSDPYVCKSCGAPKATCTYHS